MILWICPNGSMGLQISVAADRAYRPGSSVMLSPALDYPPPARTAVPAAIFSSPKQARTALQVFSDHWPSLRFAELFSSEYFLDSNHP